MFIFILSVAGRQEWFENTSQDCSVLQIPKEKCSYVDNYMTAISSPYAD